MDYVALLAANGLRPHPRLAEMMARLAARQAEAAEMAHMIAITCPFIAAWTDVEMLGAPDEEGLIPLCEVIHLI